MRRVYKRTDVARDARREGGPRLELSPDQVASSEFAGEEITAVLTEAPGNGAPIGGLKVAAPAGWFAARPSGTEDVYKVYAESFRGEEHLERIVAEAGDREGRAGRMSAAYAPLIGSAVAALLAGAALLPIRCPAGAAPGPDADVLAGRRVVVIGGGLGGCRRSTSCAARTST